MTQEEILKAQADQQKANAELHDAQVRQNALNLVSQRRPNATPDELIAEAQKLVDFVKGNKA